MTVTNIPSPEDNPFSRIKVRHIFGWLLLFTIAIAFQLAIISHILGINLDNKEPFVNAILGAYLLSLSLSLFWRECRLAGIEIKYLIGKVPDRYQWLPLVRQAFASVVFLIGLFGIFYYPLSFLVPSFVEQILTENINKSILIAASKSTSPALYYLQFALDSYVITPVFATFFLISIPLHRWAAKWGNITAIIVMCLLLGTLAYKNFTTMIISLLIYALLYVKTRSLLVVILFTSLQNIIFTVWNLSYKIFLGDNQTGSTLEIFRSQIQLRVLFFALSAPWVIGFIYKNWSVLKGPLPYFANASEAEKIKADSET
jgi:membrane protease YdiL (CAAX protease family)